MRKTTTRCTRQPHRSACGTSRHVSNENPRQLARATPVDVVFRSFASVSSSFSSRISLSTTTRLYSTNGSMVNKTRPSHGNMASGDL